MIEWLRRQGRRVRMLSGMIAAGHTDELLYGLKVRFKKLDLEFVSVSDLGLSEARSHWYSNSGGPELARVLRQLHIGPSSRGLDLGSGKGGAVLTMADQPFTRVTGVELSPQLVEIARENARRLGLRNVNFVQSDAAAYRDLDEYTHVYMYNPFPCAVMQAVLGNFAESFGRRERPLTLVYKNPVCHDAIEASGLFAKAEQMKLGEHWWYIYRHAAPGAR